MPRKFLRRYLNNSTGLKSHWLIAHLGSRMHHPSLWQLNRRSVSGAAGVGLFLAFLPVPFQLVLGALSALWLRINLFIIASCILLTNPFTMGPAFYACYRLGAWMLDSPTLALSDAGLPDLGTLLDRFSEIWRPMLAGSLVVGTVSGICAYALINLIWRYLDIQSPEAEETRRDPP
jgi:uncharacterized protein (DUF2062 family)